jgi:membrane associated rhomboid family serine protease
MSDAADASALAGALIAHWSPAHALANAAAIVALGAAVARRDGVVALLLVLGGALAGQAVAVASLPASTEFRGASGFAYALAAFMVGRAGREHPAAASALAAAGLAYMAAQCAGATGSPWIPEGVVPEARVHAAGIAAGLIAAAWPTPARARDSDSPGRRRMPRGHD